jgi:cysteinyl-tRNA synthetase
MVLRLYNTLTRRMEEFTPLDPARVTFYSCGPTVYDDAHIGNFRSFLAGDVLRRWIESPLRAEALRSTGGTPVPHQSSNHTGGTPVPQGTVPHVTHVMNITDVGHMTDDAEGGESGEDRMAVAGRRLAEAKKQGALPAGVDVDPSDPYAIARFYEHRFIEDARTLGLKVALEAGAGRATRPELMPRATESVPGMIRVIERLVARGHAYAVGPAGQQTVYFDVRSFPPYGALSGNTLESLRAGEGGRVHADNQAQKRHPADFLLWKSDPRHVMKWKSPWGEGYPGWHIECTVMSAAALLGADALEQLLAAPLADGTLPAGLPGAFIDLHSGGEDNIFPHHECEIAQSCAAFGREGTAGSFARHWFHVRHLMVNGQKMSKSKGNFFTIRDLLAKGHEPAAIRLELIRTHYRSNADFTEQGLRDSARMIERWRRVAEATGPDAGAASAAAVAAREEARAAFVEAMDADLNVAGAIAALNTFVGRVDAPTAADAALVRAFDQTLGVLERPRPAAQSTAIGVFLPGVTPDPRVLALLEERRAARAAKDFKKSDEIRDQIAALGFTIKDVKDASGAVKVEVGRKV